MNILTSSKRILVLALCALFLIGSLAGCGNSGSDASSTDAASKTASTKAEGETANQAEPANGDGPVVVKYWIRTSSKENNQSITFDEYNASQNEIKIEYEGYGDNYTEVIKLALNSGEVPDSFSLAGLGSVQPYAAAGYLYPLDDLITDEYRSQFNPSAFTQHVYEGKVYSIPDMARYIRVYYNRKLYEAAGLDPATPPASLEEMAEFAQKITDAGKGEFYGFGLPIKSGSTWERNVDNIAILSGLTGPWAFDYTTGRFDFAKQLPILQYFHDLFKSGVIMPGSESMDIEMVRANFATDKIGMYLDGNWMINGYNNELEAAKELDYDTALVPIFAGSKRAKDYLTMDSGYVITAKSAHKEETYKAMQYVIENLYEATTRKYPDRPLPSLSLMPEVDARINNQPNVKNMRGMGGILLENDRLSSFPVVPSQVITLEGDNRETVYPLLVIEGGDIGGELNKLSETYNKALDQAIAEGLLNEADLKPNGFDYYTR